MMLGKVFLKRCAWRLDVAVPSSRTAVGIFYRMKIVVEFFLEGMDGIVQCIEDVAFWSHLTWLEITTGQFFRTKILWIFEQTTFHYRMAK